MLKVPSHLEVTISETILAVYDEQNHCLKGVELNRRDLNVEPVIKYTEKMFLVDPVKVAAGTGSYGFAFDSEKGVVIPNANSITAAGHGYPHGINYKADDQTITTGSTLLATLLTLGKKPAQKSSDTFNFTEIKRTVAFRRFDLGTPEFDNEVQEFLDLYLNNCNSCESLGFEASPISVTATQEIPQQPPPEGPPSDK